jgi:GxxExxY protein
MMMLLMIIRVIRRHMQSSVLKVHRVLGCGFQEAVYQSDCKEFVNKNTFLREAALSISYKGEKLSLTYKPDFICFDEVIVELGIG